MGWSRTHKARSSSDSGDLPFPSYLLQARLSVPTKDEKGGSSKPPFLHATIHAMILKMADRDAAIWRAYEFGYCATDIGRAFGLSDTRIRQILKKHDVRPRSPCIPPLAWDGEPMNHLPA